MMSYRPYLALDSAGETILCDRPQDGCFIGGKRNNYARDNISNTTKRKTKMAHVMTRQEVESHTKKLVARLLGQDAVMDDETAEKLKGFLKNKLSAEDHEQVCNMLAGDVEAEDTEPPPGDPDAEPQGKLASDAARADFNRRFPDAAKINIDSSGIQPRWRASSYSAAGAKSFAEMFPDAMKIGLL
jgi:hypothetical protein